MIVCPIRLHFRTQSEYAQRHGKDAPEITFRQDKWPRCPPRRPERRTRRQRDCPTFPCRRIWNTRPVGENRAGRCPSSSLRQHATRLCQGLGTVRAVVPDARNRSFAAVVRVDQPLHRRSRRAAGQNPCPLGLVDRTPPVWPGLGLCTARSAARPRFGVEPGIALPVSVAEVMADKGPVWDRIVNKHSLIPRRYEDIVASWQLTDYVLCHGRTCPHHSLVSTIKARQHGCHHCVDTAR